jgi:hypothetical protein
MFGGVFSEFIVVKHNSRIDWLVSNAMVHSNYVQFNDKCEFVTEFWVVLTGTPFMINHSVLLNNLIMNKL